MLPWNKAFKFISSASFFPLKKQIIEKRLFTTASLDSVVSFWLSTSLFWPRHEHPSRKPINITLISLSLTVCLYWTALDIHTLAHKCQCAQECVRSVFANAAVMLVLYISCAFPISNSLLTALMKNEAVNNFANAVGTSSRLVLCENAARLKTV